MMENTYFSLKKYISKHRAKRSKYFVNIIARNEEFPIYLIKTVLKRTRQMPYSNMKKVDLDES